MYYSVCSIDTAKWHFWLILLFVRITYVMIQTHSVRTNIMPVLLFNFIRDSLCLYSLLVSNFHKEVTHKHLLTRSHWGNYSVEEKTRRSNRDKILNIWIFATLRDITPHVNLIACAIDIKHLNEEDLFFFFRLR